MTNFFKGVLVTPETDGTLTFDELEVSKDFRSLQFMFGGDVEIGIATFGGKEFFNIQKHMPYGAKRSEEEMLPVIQLGEKEGKWAGQVGRVVILGTAFQWIDEEAYTIAPCSLEDSDLNMLLACAETKDGHTFLCGEPFALYTGAEEV